ncbi:sigma-70 family RNA polymerase sigma factor, partial [Aeromicrobium sp.]|uniref:sigma-70 family RNA polymerase sigma factor n=1 Tax=Aeromicrobium sp. TaxID=1871063 RepID=UPI0028AFC723
MSTSRSAGPGPGIAPDERALLAAARDGDDDAFARLYEQHLPVARGVARRIADPSDVDDVVSDAFTRTLSALRSGAGPVHNMAGYIATTVHRTWIDRLRRGRDVPVDTLDLEPALVEQDHTDQVMRTETFRSAFSSLTPRWQEVLWLTEVEQVPHPEIARRMDLKPNAVAALALRARRAFQDSYLREQVSLTDDPRCAAVRALLPAHVNGRTSRRDAGRVEAHIDDCASCAACLDDLRDARAHLGLLLLPLGALP